MKFKTLFPLLLLLSISSAVFAQLVTQHENGVDPFPVYKSNIKKAYIDSIIYHDFFVTFCVSFEEEVANKSYLLAAPHSKQSWMAFTYDGYKKPLVIRNIRSNGTLIADAIKKEGVRIPLKARAGATTAKISCQFQFLRCDFQHLKTDLVIPMEDEKIQNKRAIIFEGVRLRRSNLNHSLSSTLAAYYKGNYPMSEEDKLKEAIITINDKPIKASWKKSPTSTLTTPLQSLSYKVEKANENYLFLEGVQHTSTASIFKVSTYGDVYHILHLYNHKREGFVIKTKGEKIKMQAIKNIRANGALIKANLGEKETLSIEQANTPYILSFEVHFERLPEELGSFDLIEVFKEGGRAFSFYEVELQ